MAAKEHFENERLAREICQRREIDGQRYEPGTFVAIAEGRVVGVGSSFEDADAQLLSSGARLGEGMICEVTEPAIDVVRREPLKCL